MSSLPIFANLHMMHIMCLSSLLKSSIISPAKTCEVMKHNGLLMALHSLRFLSDENNSGNVPVKGLLIRFTCSLQSGWLISDMQVFLETKREQITAITYQGSTTFRIRMAHSPGSHYHLDLGELHRHNGVSRAVNHSITSTGHKQSAHTKIQQRKQGSR